MSPEACQVTASRMSQCFNVFTNIYSVLPQLFHCCNRLETKLTTTNLHVLVVLPINIAPDMGSRRSAGPLNLSVLENRVYKLSYSMGKARLDKIHKSVAKMIVELTSQQKA